VFNKIDLWNMWGVDVKIVHDNKVVAISYHQKSVELGIKRLGVVNEPGHGVQILGNLTG
jgi:hypothetical protein